MKTLVELHKEVTEEGLELVIDRGLALKEKELTNLIKVGGDSLKVTLCETTGDNLGVHLVKLIFILAILIRCASPLTCIQ